MILHNRVDDDWVVLMLRGYAVALMSCKHGTRRRLQGIPRCHRALKSMLNRKDTMRLFNHPLRFDASILTHYYTGW